MQRGEIREGWTGPARVLHLPQARGHAAQVLWRDGQKLLYVACDTWQRIRVAPARPARAEVSRGGEMDAARAFSFPICFGDGFSESGTPCSSAGGHRHRDAGVRAWQAMTQLRTW